LQEIRQDLAAMEEIPVARVAETIVRSNSTKESQSKIKFSDFLSFNKKRKDDSSFPPDAAWVAIELKAESSLPDEFLSAWQEIKNAAKQNNRKISVRGYRSDCGNVYILAPKFKKEKIQGVALVKNYISGTIKLRDIDRTLSTIMIEVARRNEYCYIEDTEFVLCPGDKIASHNRKQI
jgi:hypothetical protein